jgi:glycolate oxidase iron-sulfur subunit
VSAVRFVEREKLSTCVHCGLCLASCPTYVELGTEADSPRGRIHLMRALEDGALDATPEVIRHLDLCLGCRACETACPSGVPYGELIEAARPHLEAHRPLVGRWWRRLLATGLTSRMRRVVFAPLRGVARMPGLVRAARALDATMLAYAAALPRGRAPRLPAVLEPAGRARGTAVLLTGCVADTLFAATNHATALLLQRAGVRVLVPAGQGCCGALALHLGARDHARRLAGATVSMLEGVRADWVVTNAAGCGAMLREYGHVVENGAAVATRARDALGLLAQLGLPPPARALEATVAMHDPCHLAHGQGIRGEVRQLLSTIPGVRLTELEESDMCCGSAGTYNLTEPAMARQLLARKLGRIAASGADVVAAANPGCLMQIRAGAILRGLSLRVEHPIDLLAAAHGLVEVRT